MFSELGDVGRRPILKGMIAKEKGRFVSLCGGCADEFAHYGIDVRHIVEYLYENLDSLPVSSTGYKVAIEPGCAMEPRFNEMKAVVEKMGFAVVNRTYGCCGAKKPLLDRMLPEREAECAEADFIVLNCPYCLTKYDRYGGGKPCMHIAELVALAAGNSSTLGLHQIKPKL